MFKKRIKYAGHFWRLVGSFGNEGIYAYREYRCLADQNGKVSLVMYRSRIIRSLLDAGIPEIK